MPLFPPSCIQLKTRSYNGTLITPDGYAKAEVSKDSVGLSLTGTRFSGRRCSIPLVSPSLPPLRDLSDLQETDNGATSDNENEHSSPVQVINDCETTQLHDTTIQDKDCKRLPPTVKLFCSSPSLSSPKMDAPKEENIEFMCGKEQGRTQRRRMSESFAVQLATFKRNQEIRLSTGRRLSDFLIASKTLQAKGDLAVFPIPYKEILEKRSVPAKVKLRMHSDSDKVICPNSKKMQATMKSDSILKSNQSRE